MAFHHFFVWTGGGVCLYLNNSWSSTVTVREKLYTTDIKLLAVSLRPYYLPREFPQLFIILVYINPRADAGYQQYVTCSTRQGKTLDKSYGSVPDAFKALPLPPLGSADHHTILLAPAYTQAIKRIKKVTKDIKQWTVESILTLQGGFSSPALLWIKRRSTGTSRGP